MPQLQQLTCFRAFLWLWFCAACMWLPSDEPCTWGKLMRMQQRRQWDSWEVKSSSYCILRYHNKLPPLCWHLSFSQLMRLCWCVSLETCLSMILCFNIQHLTNLHHWQAPASEDVAEPEAPAQEQAAADEVCLNLYWTLRVSSVKALVEGAF